MGIKDETKIASWGRGTDWSTVTEGKCWIVNLDLYINVNKTLFGKTREKEMRGIDCSKHREQIVFA